jgi:hypothetical protein
MGLRCPNVQCEGSGSDGTGSIIRYVFYKTKWGKRISLSTHMRLILPFACVWDITFRIRYSAK